MSTILKNGENLKSRLKFGVKIAIVGKPNVGKSSLINLLSKQDLAIVTDQAGTTRDVLSVNLDLGGFPVILYDTAGIRENSKDQIEQIGISKAKKLVEESDICLVMEAFNDRGIDFEIPEGKPSIKVLNKVDLAPENYEQNAKDNRKYIHLSCNSDDDNGDVNGTAELIKVLTTQVDLIFESISNKNNEVIITEERQLNHLEQILEYLQEFEPYLEIDRVISTEYLRLAYKELLYILGEEYSVDNVLDVIFGNFCIGK